MNNNQPKFEKLDAKLAENQTPPKYLKTCGFGCEELLLTPFLQPDGTYKVWANIVVTKEQLEKMGRQRMK